MEYPQVKIILFDSDEELKQRIISLRPDILLKGQDYTDVSRIIGYGLTSILVLPKSNIEEETKTTTELINANSNT
jgi:bifunctional ADP-heptose synthase (sugar kinase/adenylyltransferase)